MENKEMGKLHSLMQLSVFLLVTLDVIINVYMYSGVEFGVFFNVLKKFENVIFISNVLYTKILTLIILLFTGVGTTSKKDLEFDLKRQVIIPLIIGVVMIFVSILFIGKESNIIIPYTSLYDIVYILLSFLGAILTLVGVDNISKYIKSNFGKDKWNVEGESFQQETKRGEYPSVVIPMEFYYKTIQKGYINIDPFRATLVIGTPGSGKSFSIIDPYIRQVIEMGFTGCIYDFKTPTQARIAYYHYLLKKQEDKEYKHMFNVINLDDVTRSKRVNPLKPKYLKTLSEATELSTSLLNSLKKGEDSGGGSSQFFTQSGINFLTSCVYFLAKYENGKYSSLPHLLAFLNRSYEEIFTCIFTNEELESLLSPFRSAFEKRALEQLEGQVGTLKIFISRLDNYETRWVFGGDDIELKISDKKTPSLLILASNPKTKGINSALYSIIFNRLIALINEKGNLPSTLIADEFPTIYIHKIQELIATARSNKVAVLLGLQEIAQLKEEYGDKVANTIKTVIANIISGSVRDKETLQWLVTLFGKVKQKGEGLSIDRTRTSVSLNERLDDLIPAGKIANLNTGELVGMIAKNATGVTTGKDYTTSAINCRATINMQEIKEEEENYVELPIFYDFGSEENKEKVLKENFKAISLDIENMVNKILGRDESMED